MVNDLVEEATTSADGIVATLTDKAKEAWMRFKVGYITFHVTQERYRLSDLGLSGLTTPFAVPGAPSAVLDNVEKGDTALTVSDDFITAPTDLIADLNDIDESPRGQSMCYLL